MKTDHRSAYSQLKYGDAFDVDDNVELVSITEGATEGSSDFKQSDKSSTTLLSSTQNIAEWSSCCVNLTSTVIGAGIIGMPFALSKCGWLLGTVLLLTSALLSGFGSHLLACCAIKLGVTASSFYSVANATIPSYSMFIDAYIALVCFGVATSYLCIIGNSMTLAMEQLNAPAFLQMRSVCIMLTFILIAPISFMPSLDSLKFTSWLSGVMLLYLVLLIFLYTLHIPNDWLDPCLNSIDGQCKGDVSTIKWSFDTVKVLPIFIFNYSCQQNVFTFVNELKDPTPYRINTVILASICISSVLYLIVAHSAYQTFGDLIISDILQMYPETPLTTTCRFLISFIVALHYPLQLNPVRKSLLALVGRVFHRKDGTVSKTQYSVTYYAITSLHLVLSLLIALTFEDLGTMLAILGATGSTLVIFILPGLCYYILHQEDDNSAVDNRSVVNSVVDCETTTGMHSSDNYLQECDVSIEERVVDKENMHSGKGPIWKLYAALIMFAIGVVGMPLCLWALFM